MKINFLRFTVFIPLLVGFGMGTALIYKINSQLAFFFTLKALALFAAFLPARVILFFANSTKETTRGGTKVTMALLFVVFLALLFLGFGAAFLFITEAGPSLLCGAIATAISLLFYFGYRWLFNQGRVDLMYVST